MTASHPSNLAAHQHQVEVLDALLVENATLRGLLARLSVVLRTGQAVINVHDLDGPASGPADRIARLEARNAELEQVVARAQAALPEWDRWRKLLLYAEEGHGVQAEYDRTLELQELLAAAAASTSVFRPAGNPSDPAQLREDIGRVKPRKKRCCCCSRKIPRDLAGAYCAFCEKECA